MTGALTKIHTGLGQGLVTYFSILGPLVFLEWLTLENFVCLERAAVHKQSYAKVIQGSGVGSRDLLWNFGTCSIFQ